MKTKNRSITETYASLLENAARENATRTGITRLMYTSFLSHRRTVSHLEVLLKYGLLPIEPAKMDPISIAAKTTIFFLNIVPKTKGSQSKKRLGKMIRQIVYKGVISWMVSLFILFVTM